MDNALVAEAFPLQEPVTTKPAYIAQRKTAVNFFKTILFLLGICVMIINQVKKDKPLQTARPENSGNISLSNDQAVSLPFSFIK